ncbi:AraC family transcriptional regulator [Algoriphagus sediminis]|uniref:AraC family transcriptional regulator n=1 Tax=Algoriphagus sediminis TaxID=3057113 RepID=A0ABT7YFJ1_9BACT|nr:AraC family transcriptional regulator [Algoriphagus sediminis]MDN3205258.1 AraC family transcriptional regulator [Algoriphagus sediminis]
MNNKTLIKVVPFQIPKSDKEFIRFQEDEGAHFYDRLHQHPEIQLTLIRKGHGQFLSRGYVGRFKQGDVFLLGENVPHVFRSDPEFFEPSTKLISHGISIFFDLAALKTTIQEVEDLKSMIELHRFAGKSFQIAGGDKYSLSGKINQFKSFKGLRRMSAGLEILDDIISDKTELVPLGLDEFSAQLSEKDGQRMNLVIQYILENQFSPISLDEVANIANLSKEAFCRFFKERTRMTFTQYLNQLRVMEAKKLLENPNLGVTQIAFQVGYENVSYFHRMFKKFTGYTPNKWRRVSS